METVTVAASRGFELSAAEVLIGSVIVIAVLAWVVFSGLRHFRGRQHEPRI
jgi:hypothetical protein